MRILKVIDTLNVGGAEKVYIDLTNLLYEHGIDVSALFILYPGKCGSFLNINIRKFILNRKNKWSIVSFYRCAKILRKFDIIHCHNRYVFSYINLSSIIFLVPVKIILHDHYGLIDVNKSIPKSLSGILKPKFYIAVSNKLLFWAREDLKVDSRNIYLLSNIVRFPPSDLNYKKNFDWILIANIKPIKNQLFAVKLACLMSRSLLIVGEIQDSKYHSEILQYIQQNNCNIEFRTNVIDVYPFISQASMALHVSRSESGPLVLIEYMSIGLPFITFDTGEVTNEVKCEFPEMVISNFDFSKWKHHIEILEAKINRSYINSIKQFYNLRFSENEYVKRCIEIYQDIKKDF